MKENPGGNDRGEAGMFENNFGGAENAERATEILERKPRKRALGKDGGERTDVNDFSVGDPEDSKKSGSAFR